MAVLATENSRSGIMEALAARGGNSCTVDVLSGHTFTWTEVVQNGINAGSVANPTFPFTLSISTGAINDWKVVTSPIFFEISRY
jgi:hypothetical protein